MAAEQDQTPIIDRVPGDPSSTDGKYVKTGYANEDQQKSDFSGLSSQIAKNKGMDSSPGKGVQAIFNDFYVVHHNKDNYPILETDEPSYASKRPTSFKDLIQNPKGARIYKAADFVYCARHGSPINRMITLRRFAYPVLNDILDKHEQPDPDIARLVTYMDSNTNPMNEIMKLAWHMNWADKEATIENVSGSLKGDERGMSGLMGEMARWIDPVSAGNAIRGEASLQYDPYADTSKEYGPKDSIAKTTIRKVGLETEMEFQITFDYELRSINGVNQKRAFIDLMANILACTYNDGEFWGGARYWTGARPAWNLMNKFRMTSPQNFNDFLYQGQEGIRKWLNKSAGELKNDAIKLLEQVASNAMMVGIGKLLDMFGRAAIPQFNSLLLGEPTGSWHLTFGNPMNPIMSIGNLILKNTEFAFDSNDMSYDDLPDKFHVTCTLTTGMPLDRSGLEQIFNVNAGRIYWTPTKVTGVEVGGKSQFGDYSGSDVSNIYDVVYKFLDSKPNAFTKFAAGVVEATERNASQNSGASTELAKAMESEATRIQHQMAAIDNVQL